MVLTYTGDMSLTGQMLIILGLIAVSNIICTMPFQLKEKLITLGSSLNFGISYLDQSIKESAFAPNAIKRKVTEHLKNSKKLLFLIIALC